MAGTNQGLDLTLPEQKLGSLSYCEAAPKPFADWVKSLPMANIGETARQLYHAIIELNQLFLAAQPRQALLELIRPPIHFVCNELSRHYLGQSITLPEKQRKIANLAQALQLHLAGGYKLCLTDILEQGGPDKQRKALALACHRIISDLSCTVLRASQLYCPSPAQSWRECHEVYRFADLNGLADIKVADQTNYHRTETTIADAYKRLALLGCARPNQLRQGELEQVYQLFENWTEFTEVKPDHLTDALFVINMERDAPPVYRSLLQEPVSSACYGFDTADLAERLTETIGMLREKQTQDLPLAVPGRVSEAILIHLSQALGILTKRSFKRIAGSGTLHVCVGMSAVHYFCAGETEFNRFLVAAGQNDDDDENIFLSQTRRRQDAWAGALDAGPSDSMVSADTPINFRGASGNVETGRQKAYSSHCISLVNTSPGGYCLAWNDQVPPSLQAGEILGVREQPEHPWSVAVIRWIRQVRQQGTQVGVELLAPSAMPTGVRLIQKVGNSSEFLRGLLLPELGSIGQPATLITPRLPFQTGNKIILLHQGEETQCQLSRRVSATGSISQFELKYFNKPGAADKSGGDGPSGASEDEFDSLWPSL